MRPSRTSLLFACCLTGSARADPSSNPDDGTSPHTVPPAPSVTTERSAKHHREPHRPEGWTGDRVALLGAIGLGAPAGSLGVHLDIAPIQPLAVDLGAGVSPGGPQFAVIPRVRLFTGKNRFFVVGSGLSVGRYVNGLETAGLLCLLLICGTGESPATQKWAHALWYNVEVGLDSYAADGPGFFRATVGFGTILNARDYACDDTDPNRYGPGAGCNRSSGKSLLYASAAYGFDL